MPPDARKIRKQQENPLAAEEKEDVTVIKVDNQEQNVECMSSFVRRIVMDFPCTEQPLRCVFSCNDKRLSTSAKGRAFVSDTRSGNDEFTLIPEDDGSVVLQSTKHSGFLCSDNKGNVYSAKNHFAELDKWTVKDSPHGGLYFISTISQRALVCDTDGNTVRTTDQPTGGSMETWSVGFNSGELCFISSPVNDKRIRCDLAGNLSMNKNYKGWEAWRFAKAENGHVRISPYAHGEKFLCSGKTGKVYTSEDEYDHSLWTVQKAPPGHRGVVIESVTHGRFLQQNNDVFSTSDNTKFLLDESCIWQLESAHRQTYYLTCTENGKRIGSEGPYVRGPDIYTTGFPIHKKAEEWKLEGTDEPGVFLVISQARQECLASSKSGKVYGTRPLKDKNNATDDHKWILEESAQGGHCLVSRTHNRYLVCSKKGDLTTEDGDNHTGSHWCLEPLLPRQVTQAKIKSLATAVTVGVAGTLVAPVVLGGAVALMGIAEAGVTVQIITGGIRAAEAISSVSRMALTSTDLLRSSSTIMVSDEAARSKTGEVSNRPFSSWQYW